MKLIDTFPYQVDVKVRLGISGLNNIFFDLEDEDGSRKLVKSDFYVHFSSNILAKDGVVKLYNNALKELKGNVLRAPVVTKDHLPDGDYDKWLEERDSFLEHLESTDSLVQYESKLRVDDEPKISLKYQNKSLETPFDVDYHLIVDLSELGLTIKSPGIFDGELSEDGSKLAFVFDVPTDKIITNVLNFLYNLDAEGPEESLKKLYVFKDQMIDYLSDSDDTVFSKTLEGLNKHIMHLYFIPKDDNTCIC